jgi:hypothetical protein
MALFNSEKKPIMENTRFNIDEAYIANIDNNLRKISTSFDSRTYGFRNLTKLFESIDKYQVVKNIVNGLNHPLVRLK